MWFKNGTIAGKKRISYQTLENSCKAIWINSKKQFDLIKDMDKVDSINGHP